MKAEFKLTLSFMRRHLKQQIISAVTLALFSAAVMLMLFMTMGFRTANLKTARNYYGNFGGETFFADNSKVAAAAGKIKAIGAGVIKTSGYVETSGQMRVYIGYMDKNALSMRAVRIKSGRMPRTSGEIALDSTTCFRLGVSAKTGNYVTLKVNGKGGVKTERFRITGIFYDYFSHWEIITENAVDYKDPELPSVLTGSEPENVIAVHLMYEKTTQSLNVGGRYAFNIEQGRAEDYAASLNRSTAFVTLGIAVFFLVLSLFGIDVLARLTLKDREKFMGSLQLIGITKKQSRRLFLIHGALISAAGFVIAVPLSLLLLFAVSLAGNILGITIEAVFLPLCAAAVFAVITGFTLIIFFAELKKSLRSGKKHKRGRRRSDEAKTLKTALGRIRGRRGASGSTALVILNAGCIFALVFGMFSAELSGAVHSAGIAESLGKTDYYIYIAQGMQTIEQFNENYPRSIGMSESALSKLYANRNLNVKYAYINSEVMPAFIRVGANEKNKTLVSLKKKYTFEKSNCFGDKKIAEAIKKNRLLFGYKSGETLVNYPEIIAADTRTVKRLLSEAGITSNQDFNSFESGKTVYALGGIFKKGDGFTVSLPIIPAASTDQKIIGKAKTADFKVKVAESFTRPHSDTVGTGKFFYGSAKNPCIIISASAAMKADPLLRFSFVIADNAKSASVSNASDAAHSAAAVSKGMQIIDRAQNIAEWNDIVKRQKWPIMLLVAAFILIITEASAFLTRIKLKTNMHTYALLRSVGMEDTKLREILVKDSLRIAGMGLAIGILPAAVLIVLLCLRFFYVDMSMTMLFVVVPAAISGSLILLLMTAITSVFTVRGLFKKSIVESLETEMF